MTIVAFLDDVTFPEAISRGSAGGPDWPAEIVTLGSGAEERNTPQSAPLRTYDVKYGIRRPNEAYAVLELYYAASGRMSGFRFKDWTDYRSSAPATAPAADDQALGTGDGATTDFTLTKTYTYAGHSFARRITRPRSGILVAVDGTPLLSGFSVDLDTGTVSFDVAPDLDAVLTWGGEFDVPVRFDTALNQIDMSGPLSGIPSIFLKELRE
jgi:uncharacterized protein (TIGR02217 family)